MVRDYGTYYGGCLDISHSLKILMVHLVGIRDDEAKEGYEKDNENE